MALKFADMTLKQEKVEIGTLDFWLKEMTGAQSDKWMRIQQSMMEMVEVGDGKFKARPKPDADMSGHQTELLLLCMTDANGNAVEKDWLDNLPSRIRNALHTAALKLNALTPEEAEAEAADAEKN